MGEKAYPYSMKVLIIGGTGLLGSEAAACLIAEGHQVHSLALGNGLNKVELPKGLELIEADINELDDAEFSNILAAYDGLIFAAGIDERISAPPPIFDLFRNRNNAPLERIFRLGRKVGLKNYVICGSYFTYLNRIWPEHKMAEVHPYIQSRVEQMELCLNNKHADLNIALLELPYIFGTQEGRKPVWVFLVEMLRKMPLASFFPKGGTAMLTAKQVGHALAYALVHNKGRKIYPVASTNMTWKALLSIMHRGMELDKRIVVTVPDAWFRLGTYFIKSKQIRNGSEGGLDLPKFAPVMCREAYIPLDQVELALCEDDIEAAILASVQQSVDYLAGEQMIEMHI